MRHFSGSLTKKLADFLKRPLDPQRWDGRTILEIEREVRQRRREKAAARAFAVKPKENNPQ
jgi:hypothetical protein